MTDRSILLVKPNYYSRYPPIALMKFSAYFKSIGWNVNYVEGTECRDDLKPKYIYITSLYTYEWRAVHQACLFYKDRFPRSTIFLGGIYASLMPEHARSLAVEVHAGRYPEIDEVQLDYSLVPNWDSSLISATRGCIRKCSFCAVKRLEPRFEYSASIRSQIVMALPKIVMWDNNLLASPNCGDILGAGRVGKGN